MRYTESHEWISLENGIGTVGITEHAKNELGDIVFIQLPKVGEKLVAGDVACILESTKAAVDVYAPVGGEIIEVNEPLRAGPSELKGSSIGSWLFKIRLEDAKQIERLLTEEEYGNNT